MLRDCNGRWHEYVPNMQDKQTYETIYRQCFNDTNPEVAVGLTEINNIVHEETKGAPVVAPTDETPMAGKEVTAEQAAPQSVAETAPAEGEALDDTQMAKNLLAQAKSI